MSPAAGTNNETASHPTRVRGLKSRQKFMRRSRATVAPYAGAWIEILRQNDHRRGWHVAPYAGAWIEIGIYSRLENKTKVAPYAGAWIEICTRSRCF